MSVVPETLRSDVLDRFQHLRHERGAGTNERRAHGTGTNANLCIRGTESPRAERIVLELVSIVAVAAVARRRSGVLCERKRRGEENPARKKGAKQPFVRLFHDLPRARD